MMWIPWRRESGSVANLAVNFPNQSRSYDSTRQAVHFWGYDRSMESSFFLTVAALTQLQPNLQPDVAGFLRAFDGNRERIYAIAGRSMPVAAEAPTNSLATIGAPRPTQSIVTIDD